MSLLRMLHSGLFFLLLHVVGAVPRPQADNIATAVSNSTSATTTVPHSTSSYPSPSTVPSVNPCAAIAALVSTASAAVPIVPAQLAYDCLNDVPLDATAAVPWLQSLAPYIGWQSTLAYLRDPPEGYLEPAIDVFTELDGLITGVQSGAFANEYELEFALYRLFQRAHDGHFRYLPNLIGAVLVFARPMALVSVSLDGKDVPKPYVYSDVLLSLSSTTFTPSAITAINNIEATVYLENWSQYGALQDPDALYNNVFYELAQISLGSSGAGPGTFAGSGRGAYIFPNATTTLTYENGTTSVYENFARVLQSFSNITSGADVYSRYVNPPSMTAAASIAAATATPRPGYPPPVIVQENNLIGGYYLSAPGYESVAVLSVPSFVGLPTAEQSFQDVAFNFIAQAKADGKTKLIIDVSANGGGTILQGYNLFLNLFPDLFPYGATRFRAQEAFDIMGQVVSDRITEYPYNVTNPPNSNWTYFLGVPLNYRSDVDIDCENFVSWDEKFGPHAYHGDNFTSIIRWNLSDPTTIYTSGLIVNGFQNRTGIVPSRPFEVQDVVVLYDGYCASTCTIFSEFMTEQAGVKTIAVGGRPRKDEPMQAVGGVKGTNNYGWTLIHSLVLALYALAPDLSSFFDSSVLADYTILPFTRAVPNSGQVNSRDGIRQGDETGTPLQFVYQAADCRIWYTMSMTYDVTELWKEAADVSWGRKDCAVGSIGLEKRDVVSTNIATKVKREMTAEDVKALEDSLDVWTDLRSMKLGGNGLMMP